MDLFTETSYKCSKIITESYSTSFSAGIKAFHPSLRNPIYAIYGFVRFADEIVDTFLDKDKEALITQFRKNTFHSLENKISLNPVLHAFQHVVHHYNIPTDLIESFLKSMEMDLDKTNYDEKGYEEYIYGSAEVVGLMCLKVFCSNKTELYTQLVPTAKSLGSAFQKINFLRDIKSDYEDRGRTYFPDVDFKTFTEKDKKLIEADIQKDFNHALEGIKMLPIESRTGVYVAYTYYISLFNKIKSISANQILQKRIRVNDIQKIYLLYFAKFKVRRNQL